MTWMFFLQFWFKIVNNREFVQFEYSNINRPVNKVVLAQTKAWFLHNHSQDLCNKQHIIYSSTTGIIAAHNTLTNSSSRILGRNTSSLCVGVQVLFCQDWGLHWPSSPNLGKPYLVGSISSHLPHLVLSLSPGASWSCWCSWSSRRQRELPQDRRRKVTGHRWTQSLCWRPKAAPAFQQQQSEFCMTKSGAWRALGRNAEVCPWHSPPGVAGAQGRSGRRAPGTKKQRPLLRRGALQNFGGAETQNSYASSWTQSSFIRFCTTPVRCRQLDNLELISVYKQILLDLQINFVKIS